MADVKISALPLASTPLAGTEVLPIVQSATTDQVSVANLTAGRSVSAASLTLTTTPLAAGSGGTGITSLGTGVATTLGNAINGASGFCVQDASGNLGLGVTPSAWAGFYNFQVSRAALSADTGSVLLSYNTYYNTSWKYIASSQAASQYQQYNGQHIWFNAPSGTAGNTISFTQAMTLDASGQLGIGIVGPSAPLHVYNTANSGWGAIVEKSAGSGTPNGLMAVVAQNSSSNYIFAAAQGSYASPSYKLVVTGAGDLLVGTTSAVLSGKITVQYDGASARGISLDNTYNGTVNAVSCSYNGTYVGGLTSSATATALVTSSDVSLKNNISDAASALSSMLSLPIRQFDWKIDGSHTDYGVVAQEADEHAPEIIHKGDLWSVDYGRITPRLIKAFQELAAKVAELEAKI